MVRFGCSRLSSLHIRFDREAKLQRRKPVELIHLTNYSRQSHVIVELINNIAFTKLKTPGLSLSILERHKLAYNQKQEGTSLS